MIIIIIIDFLMGSFTQRRGYCLCHFLPPNPMSSIIMCWSKLNIEEKHSEILIKETHAILPFSPELLQDDQNNIGWVGGNYDTRPLKAINEVILTSTIFSTLLGNNQHFFCFFIGEF
uniref:Uncharacterized protein n=2 Tax=Cacopsylla melanoneura TaxID=428564 RepID=A0A8D8LMS3_9HEMI